MVSNSFAISEYSMHGMDQMADDDKKWNLQAPRSVADEIDQMARNKIFGKKVKKQEITSAGLAAWLLLSRDEQRELLRQVSDARLAIKYRDETIMDALRKMRQQVAASTPAGSNPTLAAEAAAQLGKGAAVSTVPAPKQKRQGRSDKPKSAA